MLPVEIVTDFRRRSIADALGELCVERGYRATTIDHIVARAKTSRSTVYANFDNREQIFLALLDRASTELFSCVECACAEAEQEMRIEAALAAVLEWTASHSVAAWAFFVESSCATPESFRRYANAITDFASLLRGNTPSEVPRPSTFEESLVGGVASILRYRIYAGEAKRATELLPQLTTFLRTPFLAVDLAHDVPGN